MKKQILEKFISKYSLSGEVESVKWKADGGKLAVHFVSTGNSIVGQIESSEIQMDDGEYNIFGTSQLRSLLAVLDDEITINIKSSNNKASAFLITDYNTKATFALSDPRSIPSVPVLKQLPPTWEAEFVINQKFKDSFVKGQSALSDIDVFAVMNTNNSTEVIIGYEPTINTHNVVITPEILTATNFDPVYFPSKLLKDVFAVNKEMPDTKISVSTKGLLMVKFQNEHISATYYLFAKKK